MKRLALLGVALFALSGSAWAFTAMDVSTGSGVSFATDVSTQGSVGYRIQHIKLLDGTTSSAQPILGDGTGRLLVTISTPAITGTVTVVSTVAVSVIQQPLPAGTNNIGDVDVLTMPTVTVVSTVAVSVIQQPLPAGTNNIGDVDVLTLPALVAGTAQIGLVSGSSTTVTNRALRVNSGVSPRRYNTNVSGTETNCMPADPTRIWGRCTMEGSQNVKLGGAGVTMAVGGELLLGATGYFKVFRTTDAVQGIAASSTPISCYAEVE